MLSLQLLCLLAYSRTHGNVYNAMLIEKGRLLFVFFYYLYFHRIIPVLLQIANIKQWMQCNWRLQCILSIVKQRRSEYANVLYIEEHAGPISWTRVALHTICHSIFFFFNLH